MSKCDVKLECAWHRLSTVDQFVVVYEFLLTSIMCICGVQHGNLVMWNG